MMILSDLISATEYMWGGDAQVFNTKIDGIYDTSTARHGGYLVDTTLHPELRKYGDKTNIPSLRAFEEDYEALKVLWLYPELINNIKESENWLTPENVIRFDNNDNFLKDFPNRRIIENEIEEEDVL